MIKYDFRTFLQILWAFFSCFLFVCTNLYHFRVLFMIMRVRIASVTCIQTCGGQTRRHLDRNPNKMCSLPVMASILVFSRPWQCDVIHTHTHTHRERERERETERERERERETDRERERAHVVVWNKCTHMLWIHDTQTHTHSSTTSAFSFPCTLCTPFAHR